ncbi:1-acyl-sn-glycerol-3-phosphate acyltransferase [Fluviicoccus keumensis]|uniref:1-acyl-sn-glycerol-3-phosphate acyltransferase n=1 Tax=Fluviicoccus keumensis TaxID=1435465 RepID=A0A4Q7YMM8_9GAMM|nr:lysophospholipid acyltransferase family protein [Fluviicoccus keumensis]RZU38630.1 1-acyl-sn-glycerol-3-phosphate acyltransferase [Fluviicoccus keumensis]
MSEFLKKALGAVLTPVFLVVCLVWLCIFHAAQIAALRLGGARAHRRTVDALNGCLIRSLWLLGNRPRLIGALPAPSSRPLIVVANHQSTLDVVGLGWYLRRLSPCFVAKRELGRGIPSVSYNLRHSGAALIDRSDARQSLSEIGKLGARLREQGGAVVIFPEGTRSKRGGLKPFAAAGVKILLKKCPEAWVLPVCIHDTWRLNRFGKFPMGVGERFVWSVLPAIDPAGMTADEAVQRAEAVIRAEYERLGG